SALPFTAGAPTSFPYDRSVVDQPNLRYHAFVYLRYVLSDAAPRDEQLLPALRVILADPHRRITRGLHSVPLELVRRIDVPSLVDVASGRHPLAPVKDESAWQELSLARALRGHLPTRMTETYVDLTPDTPENRFVKAFCDVSLGVIDGMRRDLQSRKSDVFAQRVLEDCAYMDRLLRPIRTHPFWTQVGPMNR